MKDRTGALALLTELDYSVCAHCNRVRQPGVVRFWKGVSRLGDGVLWYVLMVALPLLYGWQDLLLTARMAGVGAFCLTLYVLIKRVAARPRPYERHEGIELLGIPLDRYAFPSGHTMHAVAFTVLVVARHPELGWLLVPFTLLLATSRVVLGLHYPSEVLAGGALGATIAILSRVVI